MMLAKNDVERQFRARHKIFLVTPTSKTRVEILKERLPEVTMNPIFANKKKFPITHTRG